MLDSKSEKKVAILATDGFEQSELFDPITALNDAGIQYEIVSPKDDNIKGWNEGNWGKSIEVDRSLKDASYEDYDALLLPGGVINPDKLRRDEKAVNFVRNFFGSHKPVAAICHGPQMLIEAEVVKGRTLTSFHAIRKDLENAGANWVDEEVVVDEGLVTSRSPKDLPAFNRKLVEEVREGKHEEQTV